MLKTQITGAKYLSPQTNQTTNLNIAVPADSKDTEFGTSDILLAKDVIKLTNNADPEVINEIKRLINTLNDKIQQNSVNIDILNQKFTGLFEIVNTLPNINDAQLGKIYCVKDTSSTETENKYIEWVKLKNTNETYKFEKVGEFNATPDLSGYARLDDIGTEESFIFTLEDGSKVIKSIRVVSTTTTPAT